MSKLYEFLLNPQARVHSGPVPDTSRKSIREIQGANEDRFQNEPHPGVGVSMSQSSQENNAAETSHNFSIPENSTQ